MGMTNSNADIFMVFWNTMPIFLWDHIMPFDLKVNCDL